MHFKRNQVEEAIIRTLEAEDARGGELRLKLKRLLVTDRRLRRGGFRYAFFSHKPSGSGVEVMFSGYEAFALMAALIVLEHGIPQGKVVAIFREIRGDLEAAHRDTLQTDPKVLFDEEAICAAARPGQLAVDNTAPVFLAFVKLEMGKGQVQATISVCHGLEGLTSFLRAHSVPGSGSTHFELVRLMHALAANLLKTRPVKRGRSTV